MLIIHFEFSFIHSNMKKNKINEKPMLNKQRTKKNKTCSQYVGKLTENHDLHGNLQSWK